MSFLRRRASSSPPPDGRPPKTISARPSIRAQRALLRNIANGVQRWTAQAQESGVTVIEVQPVLQVVAPQSYEEFRAGWMRAWAKHGGAYSAEKWVRTLAAGEYAVLLLPLPAGRVGVAVGRHPRAMSRPLFLAGRPPHGRGYSDTCAHALATWLSLPTGPVAPLLAPPVIEVIQRGQVEQRYVEEFGAQWPLAQPDGL